MIDQNWNIRVFDVTKSFENKIEIDLGSECAIEFEKDETKCLEIQYDNFNDERPITVTVCEGQELIDMFYMKRYLTITNMNKENGNGLISLFIGKENEKLDTIEFITFKTNI